MCTKIPWFRLVLFPFIGAALFAQTVPTGTIKGVVIDQAGNRPIQAVTVTLKAPDGGGVRSGITDEHGAFVLNDVPFGDYRLAYNYVGFDTVETAAITLDAGHAEHDFGQLALKDSEIKLDKFNVTAQKQTFYSSIDRKIYNVGQDVQSVAGSAADVLRNIPSVDVDIDGNLSLRGNNNVLILIDGRTSALMSKASQADVLSQYPADAIDHIEVITNPSAKYKPDGTAGIINIVLKKKRPPGFSGSIRLTVGNNRRFGVGFSGNYHLGKFNFYGGLTLRQDDRVRTSTDRRTYIDPVSGLPASTQSTVYERARPLFQIGQFEVEYKAENSDRLSEAIDSTYRRLTRYGTETDQTIIGSIPSLYNRLRYDPEYERDVDSTTKYEHRFGRDDHTLGADFSWQQHTENEDNHYTNIYTNPVKPTTFDHIQLTTNEPITEASAEYSNTLADKSKVEAGFDRTDDTRTDNHVGQSTDPATGLWVNNTNLTNEFILQQAVTAVYGTYERTFGKFGALAGLRLEDTAIKTDQVTAAITTKLHYFRLYPSLHLAYNLSATGQLQLNYSHRVRRPESDDFNPYPEFQDPYNLRAGNPRLKPEETHSIEAGYQYRKDDTTYLAALFYRYTYNTFTTVSQYINSTTLLTTQENIGKSRSGGLELAATFSPWKPLSLNASGDIYYNQIDASNLGYGTYRSTLAGTAKMGVDYAWSKTTLFQFNLNYVGKRLTPQGYRLPTLVANLGVKHQLRKNLSLVAAISDLFNTQRDETKLDTPTLHDDYTRRRNSRFVYVGLIYSFGSSEKKGKAEILDFEN